VALAATGLLQGFVYFLAYELWPSGQTLEAVFAGAVFVVTVTAVTVHLSWTGANVGRLFGLSLGIAALFGLAGFWTWLQFGPDGAPFRGDDQRAPTMVMATVISAYALIPFVQIFQRSGRRAFPYPDLFRHGWNNGFILLIGGFLAGAFWLIIMLWSELFKLIDVTFFEDTFTSAAFVSMSLTTVFGYGVALGRESERITNTLRGITLAVFRIVMPLLAAAALLFLVALPFTGLQPLWETGHATAVLLGVIALAIVLFNAVYQDGEDEPPSPRWVRHGIEAALVVLPIYFVIAFYAVGLRIDQYGLTVPRFYGVLLGALGMLYGVGYAVSIFWRRERWMDRVQTVNLSLVWVAVALALLVHTPVLDPLRWSARSQVDRLARGDVPAEEFDYGFLRFELGHVGYEQLGALEDLSDHPEASVIREQVRIAREADSYGDLRRRPTVLLTAGDLVSLPERLPPPGDLVDFLAGDLTRGQTDGCREREECLVFSVSLDDDEDPEWVLVLSGETGYGLRLYDRTTDGSWEHVGVLRPVGGSAALPTRSVLLDSLEALGSEAVATPYRDLSIGGVRLRLRH
jgi:hypothetical protein